MTIEEAIDVLTAAAAFDRRTVGKADAAAWHAALGDLPFEDAQSAVVAHYRDSREWIMPSDIRRRVKALRADRLARTPLPAPPPELADKPAAYRAELGRRIQRLADGFEVPSAITGAAREDGPPGEYVAARKALPEATPPKPDLMELAREQVAKSRRERTGGES